MHHRVGPEILTRSALVLDMKARVQSRPQGLFFGRPMVEPRQAFLYTPNTLQQML